MNTRATTVACFMLTASVCFAQVSPRPSIDRNGLLIASPDVVAGESNQFAVDLYAKLAAQKKGNLFFSPGSIDTALAMTYAGARSATAEQMAKTLHFSLPADKLSLACAELITLLNNPGQVTLSEPDGKTVKKPAYELSVANALWGQKGYAFKPEFTKLLAKSYGAAMNDVDFAQTEAAREKINHWAAFQTKDKIKDLIAQGVLAKDTRLVLTNAIYFKSNWQKKFEKDQTKEEEFQLSAQKMADAPLVHIVLAKVPMMHQESRFPYLETDDIQLLELPYMNEELSMLIVLPKKVDGLANVEKGLTAESIEKWHKDAKWALVNVTLPKFSFSDEFQLADTLSAMGMKDAFDVQKADFSGMTSEEKLFISKVIHKAFVAVDEEGTEAAAATAVVMAPTAMPAPEQAKVFKADHPFLFLIRHNKTGQILFVGRVADPSGGAAATSQPTSQPVDAKEVARLIALLSNDTYKVREDATSKLVAMGDSIVPLLKAKLAEKGLELEMATRLETVLKKLDKSVQEGTSITDEATGITVSIENGSVTGLQGGKMMWRTSLRGGATSLKLEKGQVIVAPSGSVLDLKTGRVVAVISDDTAPMDRTTAAQKAEILKRLQEVQAEEAKKKAADEEAKKAAEKAAN